MFCFLNAHVFGEDELEICQTSLLPSHFRESMVVVVFIWVLTVEVQFCRLLGIEVEFISLYERSENLFLTGIWMILQHNGEYIVTDIA